MILSNEKRSDYRNRANKIHNDLKSLFSEMKTDLSDRADKTLIKGTAYYRYLNFYRVIELATTILDCELNNETH